MLRQAARQTEQSIRLGYWMNWNDPDVLRMLADKLLEDPAQEVTVDGPMARHRHRRDGWSGAWACRKLGGSYFTFATENNYTIWTFLKKVWEKGWLYKGHDVMPWCPRCETGISQHEIVTDGYRDLTHDAPVVRFPLRGREQEALLVWTTTPWTLTSNVAAAVGPELTYVKVKAKDGWTYYLAKGTLENVVKGKHEVLGELKGEEMLGWDYDGPFDELPAVQDDGYP